MSWSLDVARAMADGLTIIDPNSYATADKWQAVLDDQHEHERIKSRRRWWYRSVHGVNQCADCGRDLWSRRPARCRECQRKRRNLLEARRRRRKLGLPSPECSRCRCRLPDNTKRKYCAACRVDVTREIKRRWAAKVRRAAKMNKEQNP